VYVDFEGTAVGYYSFEILEKRLKEKLRDMFVALASTRDTGQDESFLYHSAIFCSNPSATEFVRLIEQGDIMLEIRMHITPSGGCRNHGSGFRIKMNKWPELFASVQEVRAK
jgi:MvaI/BcnI restriction endonuclease family